MLQDKVTACTFLCPIVNYLLMSELTSFGLQTVYIQITSILTPVFLPSLTLIPLSRFLPPPPSSHIFIFTYPFLISIFLLPHILITTVLKSNNNRMLLLITSHHCETVVFLLFLCSRCRIKRFETWLLLAKHFCSFWWR